MTRDEWERASAGGRRWALFGDQRIVVRILSWSQSGVRVRYPSAAPYFGLVDRVHPDYLHLS